MFGIIYALTSLIGTGISGLKASIENSQAKSRGIERLREGDNTNNTYFDRRGTQRDLSTNKTVEEIVFHKSDLQKYGYLKGSFYGCMEGDDILIDTFNHTLVRNISEIKRNEVFQKDNNGKTVVDSGIKDLIGPKEFLDGKEGKRYIDLKTREMYLCRRLPVVIKKDSKGHKGAVLCFFYISEQTGLIIREADSQKEYEEEYIKKNWNFKVPAKEEKEKFVEEFNKMQKEGGWMKLKNKQLEEQGKLDETKYIGFNPYTYKRDPKAFFFCNKFNDTDEFVSID